MKSSHYKGHTVELDSEQLKRGRWIARATVVVEDSGRTKRIPIFGRRRGSFATRREADAYALELAKLWIEGKLWGANGHG
jgi:hypothetical protein